MEENLEKEEQFVDKETYLRLLADFDNLRKRNKLEKEEIVKNVKTSTMETIFSLIDEIKLAQMYEPHSGLEKILDKLKISLEKEGYTEIDMTSYNEDLMEVISYGAGEKDKIVGVIKTGYLSHGEVCRWAQVILGNGAGY